MASIPGVAPSTPTQHQTMATLRSLLQLRTVVGYILLFATVLFTFGAEWDITSHKTVGRDATFTPAHVTMLSAITITGIAAMVLVLIESSWARRNAALRPYGIQFAQSFFGPVGAYIAGFGAVASAIAFPLDNYWHSLYGIDVSLWAPFHVMIFMGSVLSTIGATYLLISTAHLAASQGATTLTRLCWIAATITLSDVSAKLLGIIQPALSAQGLVRLPVGSIDLYPIMIAAALMIGYAAAVSAFPWQWAATILALVRTAFSVCFGLLIPPIMAWQIRVEHETLLSGATRSTTKVGIGSDILTILLTIVLALVIDAVVWYARYKRWSLKTLLRTLFAASLPVLLVIAAVGFKSVHLLNARQIAQGLNAEKLGIGVILVSLILVPVGALIGQWCGQIMGQSLKDEVK